jgi:hypothetical protein
MFCHGGSTEAGLLIANWIAPRIQFASFRGAPTGPRKARPMTGSARAGNP